MRLANLVGLSLFAPLFFFLYHVTVIRVN